jgi:hypothetical protein
MSVSTWIAKYLVGKMKVFCEISIHVNELADEE